MDTSLYFIIGCPSLRETKCADAGKNNRHTANVKDETFEDSLPNHVASMKRGNLVKR